MMWSRFSPAFAPKCVSILFLPFSSTVMYACPESSLIKVWIADVSTPSCLRIDSCFLPISSFPTHANKATFPWPRIRDAATETFPPFPPVTRSTFSTTTSSPDRGRRLTKRLTSQFRAPVTTRPGGKLCLSPRHSGQRRVIASGNLLLALQRCSDDRRDRHFAYRAGHRISADHSHCSSFLDAL